MPPRSWGARAGVYDSTFSLLAWLDFDVMVSAQLFYFACLALFLRIEHTYEGALPAHSNLPPSSRQFARLAPFYATLESRV